MVIEKERLGAYFCLKYMIPVAATARPPLASMGKRRKPAMLEAKEGGVGGESDILTCFSL